MRRAWVLAALLGWLPACILLPNYGGPPEPARGPERAPAAADLQDFRGVIHCHSYLSHDSRGTVEEIAAAADRVGVDFLIMTDHYTDRGILDAARGFRGRTLFLAGAEIRKEHRSLLALGIERPLDTSGSWAEICDRVHAQGGLVVLGHLEEHAESGIPDGEFDGLEIYNIHAAAKRTNPLAIFLRGLFFPPSVVFPSLARPFRGNLDLWDRWLERRKVPVCAGNDAHNNLRLLGPLGGTVGTYEQMFRTVTTHVWARSLEPSEILGALREGRCYVAFEHLRDATGFSVTRAPDGRSWRVFAPETAGIRAIRGGRIFAETEGQKLEVPADPDGRPFRIEVYLNSKPWILAGPFFWEIRDTNQFPRRKLVCVPNSPRAVRSLPRESGEPRCRGDCGSAPRDPSRSRRRSGSRS